MLPPRLTKPHSRTLLVKKKKKNCSDVAPVNAFPRSTSPSAHASDWVYELTARDWQKWIGHHAANQVRNRSGCYARVHPGTDLKIISLNTNYW